MRNRFIGIISLCMVFSFLAGCGTVQAKDSDSEVTSEVVQSQQDTPEVVSDTQTTPEVVQTQEIWVQNGDDRIYGVAYVPASEDGKKVPLVIFSHELGNDHTSGERYAERLAEAGYAAYVFDFRGGTVGGNRSDGSNSEMSILTEASDLESVLAAAKTWAVSTRTRLFFSGAAWADLSRPLWAVRTRTRSRA